MTIRYTFRKARKHEKAILFRLYKRVMGKFVTEIWGWNQGWQQSDFTKHFDTENITVVLLGDELVGYCHVEDHDQELFIRMLLLLPEYQGKGIGTCLINTVIYTAKAQSKDVSLQVLKINTRARRFYEHRGFRVINATPSSVTMTFSPNEQLQ